MFRVSGFKILILLFSVSGFTQNKKIDASDALLTQQLGQQEEINALQTELMVEKTEKAALSQLSMLIRKYKNTPLEADMQMRLAELYVRRSKTVLFFELNKDSKQVIDFMPKVLKKKSSRGFINKAIRAYSYIERKYPNYENIDLVIFNNAMANQQIGKSKAAVDKYWNLVKNYKYSTLVPDAHLAIGEINFAAKKFNQALQHFLAIKKYPESRVYPYGLYKTAWTYYNLHNAEDGLTQLEEVVQYGRFVVENNIDARLDLRKEALSDMALFYSDIRPASKAYEYFKAQAGKLDATSYIFKLSQLYGSYSKYNRKNILLNDFIDNEKNSDQLPKAFRQLVDNYEDMKNRPKAVAELQRFDHFCYQSSWSDSAKQPGKNKIVKNCKVQLNKTATRLASKWLRLWKKNSTHRVFAASAEGGYAIYLSHNSTKKEAKKIRYIYADLLFQLKKYRKASEQYQLVSSYFALDNLVKNNQGQLVLKKNSKFNKMAHDARYAAIVSLEKSVGKKWSDADEQILKRYVDHYAKMHRKGKHRLDIEFKYASIVYDKKHLDKAMLLFKALGDKYSNRRKGKQSQDIYLDILNNKKMYNELKNYSKKLIAQSKNKNRINKLTKIYQQSYFFVVQNMEKTGQYKKAAIEYKKFAKENKTAPLAQEAWWNAVQLHYKVLDFLQGAKAAESYYKLFPTAVHVIEALKKAAHSYETIGNTNKTAEIFILLSKKDTKQSTRWLSLSADFEMLSGNDEKATKLYYQVLNTPDTKHHQIAMKNIELITAKHPFSKKHNQIIDIILKKQIQPETSLVQLKKLEVIFKNNDYQKAFQQAKKILRIKKKVSNYTKARARFIQAKILEDEFNRQSLKTSMDRLPVVLKLKTNRLSTAQKAYESTMRYGSPRMSVQALKHMAILYKTFFNNLKNMPLPSGLEPNDAAGFRAEIEKIAYPMEEKSIETLQQCLQLAKKYELHDGSIPEIQAMLDKANLAKKLPLLVKVYPPKSILAMEKGGL